MQPEQRTAELVEKVDAARVASRHLALAPSKIKNEALENISKALIKRSDEILLANAADYESAAREGLSEVMLDRLLLNNDRLESIANDVMTIVGLEDPVGEIFDAAILPNGLDISRRRVPLGVIASIYESRPNVTVDIASLAIKSGNACILRGGHEAILSNHALANVVQEAIIAAGIPSDSVQMIQSPNRRIAHEMLTYRGGIDLLVPRGSESLIEFVRENATVPVATGGIGVCHTFVDSSANVEKAVAIAVNAKVQRPTVCNALDTLLLHESIAPTILPLVAKEWGSANVEIHADDRSQLILGDLKDTTNKAATSDDWGKEFLSLTAAVKIVDSLEEALSHIDQYGSGHSDAILTEDQSNATTFLDTVDSAAVFVNASTRFTDGAQLGLGAEVGIITDKMHVRGPLGLRELTSYKWVIKGDGHVRP